MERRRLGRLGHESTVLIYGAAALYDVTQEVADASIDEALAAGINHFDVAAGYGGAEDRLGAAMDRLRGKVFLATKTGQRAREGAWREINRSLERLRTDRVELLQLHSVGGVDDLDRATGPDGALHAAVRAQEEGLVGAVGITGHGHQAPATHLEALRRFPFATVLTPLNPVLARDAVYMDAYEALAEEVNAQDAGLMIIKTISRRNWPESVPNPGVPGDHKAYNTWYEPFDKQRPITAAVSWVLSRPEVTGIATPGDVRLLPLLIRAEQERQQLTPDTAEDQLRDEPAYSSPFISMPI
ncbi:MAG TPA: aldo/keto reductase [Jiangellaceae bacterium]|nr:aldo/keto reductase [Jiangellaceae bacterium]